jgi:transposase, IS5 family
MRGLMALSWEDGLNALVAEGIEAIVFRTVGDQCSLWESVLPEELRRLPEELARVDALLDDPAFFAPFVPFFDPRMGRPSTPMETYLRLMFLKFRYRLGYESLCREVTDSITWRRFCRIPLDGAVPHPTTLMKLTTRCGSAPVDGLNEALLAKAAEAKLLRTNRIRADTTVVAANVAYPTDSGLLARAIRRIAATGNGSKPRAGRRAPSCGIARGRPGGARMRSPPSCAPARRPGAVRRRPRCGGSAGSWPSWPPPPPPTRNGCW